MSRSMAIGRRGRPGGTILLHFGGSRVALAWAQVATPAIARLSAMPSLAHPCVTGRAMRRSHANAAPDERASNEDAARHVDPTTSDAQAVPRWGPKRTTPHLGRQR
jgi:hypothetical protein